MNLKRYLKPAPDGLFHVIGCTCRHHIGVRSKRKGQKGQAKMHRNLGGTGWTPTHEESAKPYHVECLVMPEGKTGKQVPASWDGCVKCGGFINSEWFRKALSQSERAVPFGSGALPCVVLRGKWAIVDIDPKDRRKK